MVFSSIFLTKLDVLDSFDTIKVAVAYKFNGARIDYFPSYNCEAAIPIYEEFKGWNEPTSECKSINDLPRNALKYIQILEKFCGVPIKWLSVGSDRKQTIAL